MLWHVLAVSSFFVSFLCALSTHRWAPFLLSACSWKAQENVPTDCIVRHSVAGVHWMPRNDAWLMSCQSSLSNLLLLVVFERSLFDLNSTATVGVLMYVYPLSSCAWDMIDPLTDNSSWSATPLISRCSTWIFHAAARSNLGVVLLSRWHVMLLDPSTVYVNA